LYDEYLYDRIFIRYECATEEEINSDLLNNQLTDRPTNQAIDADVIAWKKLSARVNIPFQFLDD